MDVVDRGVMRLRGNPIPASMGRGGADGGVMSVRNKSITFASLGAGVIKNNKRFNASASS